MKLSREEVLHIATLARVGVTDEDVERFRDQLSNILENFQVLQEVDTEGVEPTAHSGKLQNVVREDTPRPSWPQEEVLANAPHREQDMFKVRPVLE